MTSPPNDPGYALRQFAIDSGDQTLRQFAAGFGATYLDFNSVIPGHVPELTNDSGPGGAT